MVERYQDHFLVRLLSPYQSVLELSFCSPLTAHHRHVTGPIPAERINGLLKEYQGIQTYSLSKFILQLPGSTRNHSRKTTVTTVYEFLSRLEVFAHNQIGVHRETQASAHSALPSCGGRRQHTFDCHTKQSAAKLHK